MKWRYKNNTQSTVIYHNNIWQPGNEIETSFPVPSSLGLTCVQEDDMPDPVLFHDDILIDAGEQRVISIDAPEMTHNVALTILCMDGGGVECRFNGANNNPIPIDTRGFIQTLSWELCSKIFLNNITDSTVHISLTAIEVS